VDARAFGAPKGLAPQAGQAQNSIRKGSVIFFENAIEE